MMTTADETAPATAIPAQLVRETLNGQPLCYKGYRDVLAELLSVDGVVGTNDRQSVLAALLCGWLGNQLNRRLYRIGASGVGIDINQANQLVADIVIFDKATLPALKGKDFEVPPKVIVEIDIRIDWNGSEDGINYILEKSQTLFNFGVERILWVLTAPRKIVILQPGQDTIITDWSNDVLVLDNCSLNIKKLLDEEEITF